MTDDKISFSKEVADTLSLESAIILEKCNEDLYRRILVKEDLIKKLSQSLSFISQHIIEESLEELIGFNLIANKFSGSTKKNNSSLKLPSARKINSNAMGDEWVPSPEALEVLDMGAIELEFVEMKIPEFKIYWIERGQQRNNWNTTFIDYIRREWAKENNSNKGLPFPIDKNWIPSDDVFEILQLSEIPKDTAMGYLAEFILYWTDNGAAFNTWNSKFIDHVKRRHLVKDKDHNEKSKNHSEPGHFKKEFEERKNDKSWAEEINLE